MINLYKAYAIIDGELSLLENMFISRNGEVYTCKDGKYCKHKHHHLNTGGNQRPYIYTWKYSFILAENIMFCTFAKKSPDDIKKYIDGTLRIIYKDNNRSNLNISNLRVCSFITYAKWSRYNNLPITNISQEVYDIIRAERVHHHSLEELERVTGISKRTVGATFEKYKKRTIGGA